MKIISSLLCVVASIAQFPLAYAAPTSTLNVEVFGSGLVASSPVGINCPDACSASYPKGTEVSLSAEPASGQVFAEWGGACAGNDPNGCVVLLDAKKKDVSATFTGEPTAIEQLVTVGVADFQPNRAGVYILRPDGAFLDFGTPQADRLVAPIHFPDDCNVKELRGFFYDNSATRDTFMTLRRLSLSGGTSENMAGLDTIGEGQPGNVEKSTTSISFNAIDKSEYSYQLIFEVAGGGATGPDSKVKGAVITCEIANP